MIEHVQTKRLWPGASVLVGLAAVVAAPSFVSAQAPSSGPLLVQASNRIAFDIPAQPLGSALLVFGQQSGRQISAEAGLVRGLSTPGVGGTMTIEEALQRLLAGTGLTYRVTGSATIALQREGQSGQLLPGIMQLDPLNVQGAFPVPSQAMIDNLPPPYAGGQVATGGQLGLLGNRPVMDTPFSQSNYTAKKAQDQQAKTIRDALIDDPSVRSSVGEGGANGDNTFIRGFPVFSASTSYGGLYGMLPQQSIMAELAERIEVLKGPSAMLSGMQPQGAIGGAVNIVPKRAPDEPLTQFTANYASNTQFGGHVDIARRFGPDKQFGVRFNGVFRSGQTGVANNTDQRALPVFGLDYRGDRVRFSADFGYQYQNILGTVPYLGLAAGVPLPWAPNVRMAQGQSWSSIERKDLFGVFRGELDLTEQLTAFVYFGGHDYRAQTFYGGNFIIVSNFNGNGTSTAANQSQWQKNQTAQAGLRGVAETGLFGHEFALTFSTLDQEAGTFTVTGPVLATNIYNPNYVQRPNIPTPAANKTSYQGLQSFGFADTISAADKRIQLTVGARLQQVKADNFNATSGATTSSYNQNALSPAVGLVFKPWENVSIYGNWIQGLEQGTIVGPTFTNAGEVFPPFKSTQFEVGVKVDWGKFTTTANVFQVSQPSTITNITTNTLVLGGEQRNRGLELNFFGEPAEGVRLLGGAMFLDAVLTGTQGGLTDGWTAPFSPGVQLNLAGEWDTPFVKGLTLIGRAIYTGSQYIDTTSPRRSLPDWARFDLGARYSLENTSSPTGKPIVLRFNVENVLDSNYWAGGTNTNVMYLGAPRTFRIALTTDF